MSTLVTSGSRFYNMYVIVLNFIARKILSGDLQDFKLYEDYPSGSKEINLEGVIRVVDTDTIINAKVKLNIIVETGLITLNMNKEKGGSYIAYIKAQKDGVYFYTSSADKPVLIIENGKITETLYYKGKTPTHYKIIENYDAGNRNVTITEYIHDNQYYDQEETLTTDKGYKKISYKKNSKLNNKPGQPAVISKNVVTRWSEKKYYKDGLPHRSPEKGKEKPAHISYFNKNVLEEKYFIDGKMHRIGKPAYIEYDKNKHIPIKLMWYSNNLMSNPNGPAYVEKYPNGKVKIEQYFLFGRLHRENGPAIILYDTNGNIFKQEYYKNGVKIDRVDEQICGAKINSGSVFNLNIDNVTFCLNCTDMYNFLTREFTEISRTHVVATEQEFQTFLNTIASTELDKLVLKKEYSWYYTILKIIYEDWIESNKDVVRTKTGDDADELTKKLKELVTISKFKNLIYAYLKELSHNSCNMSSLKIIEITDDVSNIDYGDYLNSPKKSPKRTPSKATSTSSSKNKAIENTSGLCQGRSNGIGVCWANALIQFISPISDNINFEKTERAIDKFCPMKKNKYSGGDLVHYWEFIKNVQKKLNVGKKVMDIVTKDAFTNGDSKYTVFFNMNLNDILTSSSGKISAGLSFNVKTIHEINNTHMIRSILVIIPGHALCIRLCKGNFYVFDDEHVIPIQYDLIDLINDKSLFVNLSDRYKDKVQPDEITFHSYLFEKLTT